MIGLRANYLGRMWVVIEILEAPERLVLEASGTGSVMQMDVHGRPWDYAAETVMIPVLNQDRTGLSDELLDLEVMDI